MMETIHTIRSAYLENERLVWVREPETNLNTDHLFVFLDGELYRERVEANAVIDKLLANDEIANAWFVFVSMESVESRWRECPCYPPFAKFIVEELLVWLEGHYPGITAARRRTLVGLSYTGLAAAFVAKEFPDAFQKIIAQSGSFWSDDCRLIDEFQRISRRSSTGFYLDVGRQETQQNVRHREDVLQVVSQIDAVRRFRDVLQERGYLVKYTEFDGGHDFIAWRKTLPDALLWALAL
jgi:enterochelin esterase-like enzyme